MARMAIPFRRGLAKVIWWSPPYVAPVVELAEVDADAAEVIAIQAPDLLLAEIDPDQAYVIS
jgi:hypothetical protein